MINKLAALAAIVVCALAAPALADPVKVVAAQKFSPTRTTIRICSKRARKPPGR